MTAITADEARKQLSEIVNRVAYAKERIVLTRRGRKVAAIVSMEDLEVLENLLDEVEDRLDLPAARTALEEAEKEGTLSWDQIKSAQGLKG